MGDEKKSWEIKLKREGELRYRFWEKEIEKERSLRSHILKIGEHGAKPERTKATREWFSQVSKMLDICISRSTSGRSEVFDIVPPAHMFIVLKEITDNLGRGIIPQLVSDVVMQSRPQKSRRQELHIGYATAYLIAVKQGLIKNPAYNKTVRDAYDVSAQCVRNWAKLPVPPVAATTLQNLARQRKTENKEFLENKTFLEKKMLQCGEHYTKFGTGPGRGDWRGQV